jgi:hypothetical protein
MLSEILGNPLLGCYVVIAILQSRSGALGQVTVFPEVLTYCTERNRCRTGLEGKPGANFCASSMWANSSPGFAYINLVGGCPRTATGLLTPQVQGKWDQMEA